MSVRGLTRLFALLSILLVAVPALAGGGGEHPPEVDLSVLPEPAVQRPANMDGSPHQALAHLLADVTAVHPGQTFRLGMYLVPDEGWHAYWKSPGEIGLPIDIEWTLPEGATYTPYEYPVPTRFVDQGIVSYGYDGPVLLFTEVTLPDTLEPGTTLDLGASWLVCKSTCVPGSVELSLPVEVVDAATAAAPAPTAALFDWYAERHPTPLAEATAVVAEHALSADVLKVNEPFTAVFVLNPTGGGELGGVEADTWPTFAPIANYDWMINDIRVCRVEGGGVMAVIEGETFEPEPLPTDQVLGGLFQVKVGEEWVRTEVTVPLPWASADATATPSSSPLLELAKGCQTGQVATLGGGDSADTAPDASGQASTVAALEEMTGLSGGALFALMLVAALVGGLILNAMPCVLPVLTLKAYGLVSHAEADASHNRKAGLAYTAGILVSFWVLAAAVLVAKLVFGMSVSWGFQFQSPVYVAVLTTIVFAFGLSLFGVFEIPAVGVNQASQATQREGVLGDFMFGVFATLLSTPCSAPFLGLAVGFAFSQAPAVIVLFFTVIALGLALPYLLVAFVPALIKLMPKPGAWMETFRQLMGFTLMATALWMVDVLGALIGAEGVSGYLFFLGFVAMGTWIFGHWGGLAETWKRQLGAFAVGTAVATLGGFLFLDLSMAEASDCAPASEVSTDLEFAHGIPWQAFSPERVDALAGKTVFIDFTADWCLTCKANERAVLETDTVRGAMAEHGVVPLRADWTRRDDTIGEWLARYGRAGVPFYLVIPADRTRDAIPLSEVITPGMVVEALEQGAAE